MSIVAVAIQRHAALIYFVLVFILSWGGALLVLGPGRFPLNANEFESLGGLFYIAILAGPCVAGILLTAVVAGWPGLRDLLARLRRWRVGWKWYVVALLPAFVMAATTLLLSLASPDLRPALFDSDDKVGVLMSALGPALLVGSIEEIGWTGFAAPHLRARHSVLATGLIIGIAWGAWHFPLFWEADSLAVAFPFSLLMARLFSWLPPLRVLLVWIHDRTQSLPVVMFAHALVSFLSIGLALEALSDARLLMSVLVLAMSMWLLLAAVRTADRQWFSRLKPQAVVKRDTLA